MARLSRDWLAGQPALLAGWPTVRVPDRSRTARGHAAWLAGQTCRGGRLAGQPTCGAWLSGQRNRRAHSAPDREHRLEVVAREDLEGNHRLRPADARELHELAGDDVGEHLVAWDTHDRDEVPLAGDGVGLGDAVEVGQTAAERLQGVALGLDEHDRGRHVVCVSPGFRTTTSPAPAFCTSDLNPSTSVSIGGNVP